jgi:hypothetical protein
LLFSSSLSSAYRECFPLLLWLLPLRVSIIANSVR